MPQMDIIILRNVLIYFDVPAKRAILDKAFSQLTPHGFLILGATEMPMNIDDRFSRVDCTKSGCYRVKN